MSSKVITCIIILALFSVNQVFADCGGDHSDGKANSDTTVKKSKVNSLVMRVNDDGNINGLVITSCGQCKLGYKGKPGCFQRNRRN